MRCPRCGRDNPASARYCMECGAGLGRGCRHCGTGDEPGRKRYLREAHRLYTEMSATGHAERVARELAELGP
jgi:hypothetical protein